MHFGKLPGKFGLEKCGWDNESHKKKHALLIANGQISYTVTAQRISAFVLATLIVQFLYFLTF